MKTLGHGLPEEMARVRELLPLYDDLPKGAGVLAAMVMRNDLDRAATAMASGDIVEMLRVYQSLKGYHS